MLSSPGPRRRAPGLALLITLLLSACTSSGGVKTESSEPSVAPPPAGAVPSACEQLDVLVRRIARGYVPRRGPEIVPIPAQPTFIGGPIEPVHTGPFDHLAEVPLVAYGPGVVPVAGRVDRPGTMADVAPTLARMIGYEFDTPDGRVLEEAVGPARPRVVVVVVWDGGGWNVLREHPDDWPFLKKMTRRGVSFTNFEIGSTPSNTPPIHTTLGTGVFPARHGIPGVQMRGPNGEDVNPFLGADADFVKVPTLADVYDRDRGNRPEMGLVATVDWHLGMLGHGSRFPGGDADVAVLLGSSGVLFGASDVYELSPAPDTGHLQAELDALDAADGQEDGRWGDEDLGALEVRAASPAWISFQQDLLEDTITAHGFGDDEVPDLMFTNFKMIDDAGHKWGPFSRQVGETVAASDTALKRLTRFLDRTVGRKAWAVVVTADHGQQPLPKDTGIWPIAPGPLGADVNARFDDNGNDRRIVERVSASGLFIDRAEARSLGVDPKDIARWLIDYRAEDNTKKGQELPAAWADDPERRLFAGVMVGRELVADSCD